MTFQLVKTRGKTLAELKVMHSDRLRYTTTFFDKEIARRIEQLESAKRGKAKNELEIKYLEEIIAKREWKEKSKPL